MAQYDNVSGVARKVNAKYENVGGVARHVLKSYDNVSGVARQYFDGVVEPLVIYDYGNECTAITGGWEFGIDCSNNNCLDHCYENNGIKYKDNDHIYIGLSNDGFPTAHASVFTRNAIDISRYKTMHVLITEKMDFAGFTASDGVSSFSFRVHSEKPDPTVSYGSKTLRSTSHSAKDGSIPLREIDVTLDVSGISQGVYPVIMGVVYQCVTDNYMKIRKVWFE